MFNIASGTEIKLMEIAHFLTNQVEIRPLPEYEVGQWRGDVSKAREKLGWEPKKDFWTELKQYVGKRCQSAK